MQRADKDLAFMLRYENIAWYDNGEVRILDRRVYPARTEFVVCRSHKEVAQAIRDMVTQSAGPFTAAPMGMALAARECRELSEKAQREYLADAADTIANARPTTARRMRALCDECLAAAEGVKGYYPSFDITPPELVTGVATPEGIFSPYELDKYVKATDGKYRVVV